jgi:3'-phosphoadenosine 5'-phosphosulfate (PAPS) 3'-phosphatase
LFFLKIISEEKDPINSKEFKLIKKQFNVEDKFPTIPFIEDQKHILTVPLSSVAVWIDPLDATKEFTGKIYD